MRALVCERYGDVDALTVSESPDPVPGAGQVCVAVRAAAVNFTDYLLVHDLYQVSAPLPFVPGSEVAGEIVSVGPDVEGWRVGDAVFAMAFVGGFADRVVLPAASLKRIPQGVDFAAAAAFFVAFSTSYGALVHTAGVRAGEKVVVLGAAGGVGLAAVQIAASLGAEVIAAASSDEKLAVCREEGAVATVNYRDQPLKDRVKEVAGGATDVVIDPVGGDLSEAAFRTLGWGGRFVVVGFASGKIGKIPLNLPLLKGAEIRAFNIAPFASQQPGDLQELEDALLAKLAAGELVPRISARYRLDEAPRALRAMQERKVVGKVVIEPS